MIESAHLNVIFSEIPLTGIVSFLQQFDRLRLAHSHESNLKERTYMFWCFALKSEHNNGLNGFRLAGTQAHGLKALTTQ